MFDVHLLSQSLVYFGIFVAGFCIAIPIGVNRVGDKNNERGQLCNFAFGLKFGSIAIAIGKLIHPVLSK